MPTALARLLPVALLLGLAGCGTFTHGVWNGTRSNPDRIVAASVDDQDVLHLVVRYDDLAVRRLSVPLASFSPDGGASAEVVERIDDRLGQVSGEVGRPVSTFTTSVSPRAGDADALLPPSDRPIVVPRPGAEELDPADFASTLLDGSHEPAPGPPADALRLELTRHTFDFTNHQDYRMTLEGAGVDGGWVQVPDPVDPTALRTYTSALATPVTLVLDLFMFPVNVGVNLVRHGTDVHAWQGLPNEDRQRTSLEWTAEDEV